MSFGFRFRLIPFIACVAVSAIGVSLGQWQLRRAAEKAAIEAQMAERGHEEALDLNRAGDAAEYRRVRMRGEFDAGWPLYLDNRPHQGNAGFYVLMPFHLEGGSRHVLVARGWQARDKIERTRLPALHTPGEAIDLQGVAVGHLPRVMQFGSQPVLKPGAIAQNIDPQEVGKAAHMEMLPLIVQQSSDTGDGLVRDWPPPSSGIDKHRGYAAQWFGLAAMALIFFIVTGFRRERSGKEGQ